MAKDGTLRGGTRAGSGQKKQSLAEKTLNGRENGASVLHFPAAVTNEKMPKAKPYMQAEQASGEPLLAKDVYAEIWKWLQKRGCEALINPQLIEQYSMNVARWIATENLVSKNGYLTEKSSGAVAVSPYVTMSHEYQKQALTIWLQIFQVVKENCSEVIGSSEQDDIMEKLLRTSEG